MKLQGFRLLHCRFLDLANTVSGPDFKFWLCASFITYLPLYFSSSLVWLFHCLASSVGKSFGFTWFIRKCKLFFYYCFCSVLMKLSQSNSSAGGFYVGPAGWHFISIYCFAIDYNNVMIFESMLNPMLNISVVNEIFYSLGHNQKNCWLIPKL